MVSCLALPPLPLLRSSRRSAARCLPAIPGHAHSIPNTYIPCAQASAAPEAAAPPAGGEQKKLWGGRFTGKTDPLMEKFNESLPFDRRMWAEDIRVGDGRSAGHCRRQLGPSHASPVPCLACRPRCRSCGLAGKLWPPSPHACATSRLGLLIHHPPADPGRVQGSQAYAKALAKAGVLTDDEAATIVEGLSK